MGIDESVMSYCYIIYLCSKVDPGITEQRKVQFIFQNMEGFPQMNRIDTEELIRHLQAHSQAALIAGRSLPLNAVLPTPPTVSKGEIEKLVWEEVTKSLGPIVEKLEQATRSLGNAGGSGFNSQMRTQGRGKNPQSQWQDRPNKRTVDGRPICNSCGKPGHIARSCPKDKGCFNCGVVGRFFRQCPNLKREDESKSQQKPVDSAKKAIDPSARKSN